MRNVQHFPTQNCVKSISDTKNIFEELNVKSDSEAENSPTENLSTEWTGNNDGL